MSDELTNGLVGFWKFEESFGRVAKDSSGNENHGVIKPDGSEFETWGSEDFKETISFTRKDGNHLSILGSDSLNAISKQITVVANFYPRSFPSKEELEENQYANYVSVVQRQLANETHPDLYYLGFGPGDEVHGPNGVLEYKWHLGIRNPEGQDVMADLYVPDESGVITPNQWMHMVGTYDGESGSLKLYLNGVEIGDEHLPGVIRMDEASESNPLVIACEVNHGGEIVGNLDAYVDEVRIYNRVLNTEEIRELATSARK